MKSPTRRYGNPEEFRYYTQGMTIPEIAQALYRDERSVRDWLSGARKMPFWVPELLRLRSEALFAQLHRDGIRVSRAALQTVGAPVVSVADRIERAARQTSADRATARDDTRSSPARLKKVA